MNDKRIPKWIIEEADRFHKVYQQQRKRINKIEDWMESKGIDVDSASATGHINYDTLLEMGMLSNGEMDGKSFAQMISDILDHIERNK